MKILATAAVAVVLAMAAGSVGPGWAQGAGGGAGAGPAAVGVKGAEVVSNGKVDAVTVYRGEALVTRVVDLPAGEGVGEIVISNLPERILAGSIFAETGGEAGVEVRSVRYRERPVSEDVREEVRKFDDQITQMSDKLAAVTKQQQVLQEERAYLDRLSNFTAPAATVEMTKGVLNADQLKTLTTFQFDQRKALADQELKLAQDQRAASEQLSLLQRQRQDVTGKSSHVLREAVVFVKRTAGGTVKLRYLVDGAGWSPSYNIRTDAARKGATVEYEASISQMSGEDWNDVTMTLSTATPNLVSAAPELSPLTISLAAAAGNVDGPAVRLDYTKTREAINELQQKAEYSRSQTGNGNGIVITNNSIVQSNAVGGKTLSNYDNDRDLNRVAEERQVLELVAGSSKKDESAARGVASSEGIVVTYDMRGRTSLPSRADQQLVQIDSLPMKSEFYKVAVPVLTSYVYDEATLTNTSKIVLLNGPVSSYVGGQFVGSGVLPTVAVGQPFTVGFGIDASLRASRERVEKTETLQGGNRVVNYTYRIAVDNYGSTAANVRLMDRLPTGKESEVRVAFVDAEKVALSADKEYEQSERKKGILRWDIEVPPEKNGSDAFSFTYKMNMEYDRNLAISAGSVLSAEELDKALSR